MTKTDIKKMTAKNYDEILGDLLQRMTAIESKLDMIYKPMNSQVKMSKVQKDSMANLVQLLNNTKKKNKLIGLLKMKK